MPTDASVGGARGGGSPFACGDKASLLARRLKLGAAQPLDQLDRAERASEASERERSKHYLDVPWLTEPRSWRWKMTYITSTGRTVMTTAAKSDPKSTEYPALDANRLIPWAST